MLNKKKKEGSVVARTDEYRPVVIEGNFAPGTWLRATDLYHYRHAAAGYVYRLVFATAFVDNLST